MEKWGDLFSEENLDGAYSRRWQLRGRFLENERVLAIWAIPVTSQRFFVFGWKFGPWFTYCNLWCFMKKNEENNTKDLLSKGAEIVGSASGAAVGYIINGPLGGIIGAGGTPIIIDIFKKIGTEIKNRIYGERELIRIGGAMAVAAAKIKNKIDRGESFRAFGINEVM